MKQISNYISNLLLRNEIIAEDDREVYAYAIEVLCCLIAPFLMISFLIPFTKLSYEGFILIIPFSMLRRYSGGFHFKNSTVCIIVSFLYLFMMEEIGKRIEFSNKLAMTSIMFLIIIEVICFRKSTYCDDIYKKARKAKAFFACSILLFCILISYFTNNIIIGKWVSLGIIMTFILQIPCLVKYIINRHS